MKYHAAALVSSVLLAAGAALPDPPDNPAGRGAGEGPLAPSAAQLVVPESLDARTRELSDTVASALERVRAFAKRHGWEDLATESFMDRVMIFDSKESFDRTLLTLVGMDPTTPLPETYCAALENRVLLAVAPELYARAYPEGVEEASYEKLLAHEVAHRLHVRILDGNEDAMGPIWFYEGFALFAADQLLHSDVGLSEEEIWDVVGDPERGSYARYAFVFRHFAARAPLQVLVTKAGEPGFVEWLHSLEGPGQT